MEQSFNGEDKSIKKSMVPFFETHGRRQRIKSYSCRLQDLGFSGAIWICDSIRFMSWSKTREADSLKDKIRTW